MRANVTTNETSHDPATCTDARCNPTQVEMAQRFAPTLLRRRKVEVQHADGSLSHFEWEQQPGHLLTRTWDDERESRFAR